MLRNIKGLRGFTIEASDGHMGRVHDLLFDGWTWAVRYLVVDTGSWLPGRKVLVAPNALGRPRWAERLFPVNMTVEQVRHAPDIDTDKPVSRQREIELHAYYDWIPYWGMGHDAVGAVPVPAPADQRAIQKAAQGDPNLRSTREVAGYHIRAQNGEIGHVDDFLVDDDDWVVRYLIVDTRNWLPGRKVLVSPGWVRQISWEQREVWVDVTCEEVRQGPPYDPAVTVDRDYETRMHDHYDRPPYWP